MRTVQLPPTECSGVNTDRTIFRELCRGKEEN